MVLANAEKASLRTAFRPAGLLLQIRLDQGQLFIERVTLHAHEIPYPDFLLYGNRKCTIPPLSGGKQCTIPLGRCTTIFVQFLASGLTSNIAFLPDPGLFTRPSRLVEAREDEGLTATKMVIGGASTGSRAHHPLSPRPIFRVVAQFKAAASNEDGRERAAAPRRDAMDRAVFSIAWEAASVAGKPVPSPTTA